MKSFFAIAAAAVASLALVSAVDCDTTKLIPLLTDPDVKKCGVDTGLSPPTPPSATVLPKLCGNTACVAALGKLKGAGVGDCSVAGVLLETDFIKPIEKFCASSSSPAPSPAPATTAPAPTTSKSPSPSTAGPTTAPSPTTVAPTPATSSKPTSAPPSTSKPSTGSGSNNTIEENKTPINVAGSGSTGGAAVDVKKTPAPTPAPGNAASSLAFATSAVVLATVNAATLAATLLAVVGNTANAQSCNSFTIAAFLIDTDVVKCTTATGLVPPSVPSADVLNKVCTNSACQKMIKSLKDLGLGDCTVSDVPIETAFITPIELYCATMTPIASSTSTTPSPTPSSEAPSRISALTATKVVAISAITLMEFCSSDACLNVLASVKSLGLPKCTVSGKQLFKDILDPAETACSSLDRASHNHTSTPSNSTVAPARTPSSSNTSGTNINNSNSTATAKTPTSTTAKDPTPITSAASKTPTPTTSSGATATSIALPGASTAVIVFSSIDTALLR
ncbi:hypothetical protein PybrP1_007683 [[Pythium] brassicae (nom. inval.)]|nr:hypothetical protein PybrP1_007683 [[Pythium] brassicae (nom. inval.)]